MYLRSHRPLGQVVTAINLDRAVCLNRHYARSLGWQSHLRFILSLLGLGGYIPDERTFAEAVACWQRCRGLPVDGIIMSTCWYQMLLSGQNLPRACQPSVRNAASNFIFNDFLSGLAAPDPFLCVAGGTTRLNSVVVDGVTNTRLRAGERPAISAPVCAATTLCPTAFQPPHMTGDATHFVDLNRNMIRVVELAGLFGLDLTGITGTTTARTTRKASVAVKALPSAPPLASLSFVAIRNGSRRQVHIHRVPAEANGSRPVQSQVNGDRWDSLAFRATPGTTYTLVKRRWHEASLHRQWGKQATIDWTIGLCNFYRDCAGLRLGIGDISHVVGEDMTDHGSHEQGRDVDAYVLGYPTGSTFPEAYFCDGTTTLTLSAMVPPTSAIGEYNTSGRTLLTGAHETDVWRRYAFVLAYCFATWGMLKTFTWHGARRTQTQTDAVAIAQAAFDAGWRSTWGPTPTSRADLSPSAAERSRKLIGQGSSSYGAGKAWPFHRDHMHIRLDM
jgi:hypothetical protein